MSPGSLVTRSQIRRGTTSFTFGTITEGNLLVVASCERSDSALSISGSGWTEVISNVLTGNTSHRRSVKVWMKVAGSSETTGITVTNGVVSIGQEFAIAGSAWGSILDDISGNNGNTNDGTSVSTGALDPFSGLRMEFIVVMSREGRGAGQEIFAGPHFRQTGWAYVSGHRIPAAPQLFTGLTTAIRMLAEPTTTSLTFDFNGLNTGLTAGVASRRITGSRTLSGNAQFSGGAAEGATIYIFDRDSHALVATATTDASGDWSAAVPSGADYHAFGEFESGGLQRAPTHWEST